MNCPDFCVIIQLKVELERFEGEKIKMNDAIHNRKSIRK